MILSNVNIMNVSRSKCDAHSSQQFDLNSRFPSKLKNLFNGFAMTYVSHTASNTLERDEIVAKIKKYFHELEWTLEKYQVYLPASSLELQLSCSFSLLW